MVPQKEPSRQMQNAAQIDRVHRRLRQRNFFRRGYIAEVEEAEDSFSYGGVLFFLSLSLFSTPY